MALRLIVDREIEIEAFKTEEYWTVEADVSAGSAPFLARMVKHEGKRLTKFDLGDAAAAEAAKAAVQAATFKVEAVEKRPAHRNPPPPFTTSTLQQEAARKLGFSAQRTMQAAQRLYEGVDIGGETVGLITYMRTDGVQSAPEALSEAREVIGALYGKAYVPESARHYRVKAKNAQEAHEAIRPTSLARNPGSLHLEPDLGRLYELVWKRMIASQMESARIERTVIDLDSADGKTGLRASGQVVLFDGYLAVYEEGRDDEDSEDGGPAAAGGAGLPDARVHAARADQHFTEPPPRYLGGLAGEEAGGARHRPALRPMPRSWACCATANMCGWRSNRFVPEDKGRLVTAAFLEQFFRPLRRVRLHRRPRAEAGPGLGRRTRLEGPVARVLEGFSRRGRRDRHATHHRGAGGAERGAGPPYLPGQGRRIGPTALPDVRDRTTIAENRPLWRLHRLLQLSGVPPHPADRRRRGRDRPAAKPATASWARTRRPGRASG